MATNRGFRMRDGQMVTYEQQKLGLSAYYDKRWVLPLRDTHRTNRISHLVHVSRRKSSVRRNKQQLFAHEAALGPIAQIVENGLIGFHERPFNVVNFQRPDWIRGSLQAPFKLARLVEITNLDKRGEDVFAFSNRPRVRCRRPCVNSFFFGGDGGFHADKACDCVVQSRNNFRKSFHPGSGPGEASLWRTGARTMAQPECG